MINPSTAKSKEGFCLTSLYVTCLEAPPVALNALATARGSCLQVSIMYILLLVWQLSVAKGPVAKRGAQLYPSHPTKVFLAVLYMCKNLRSADHRQNAAVFQYVQIYQKLA